MLIRKYKHSFERAMVEISNVILTTEPAQTWFFLDLDVQILHCKLDSVKIVSRIELNTHQVQEMQNPLIIIQNSSFYSLALHNETKGEIHNCHIDANANLRPTLIEVVNSNILIQNSKFVHFVSNEGPILYAHSNSHVTIENSHFKANRANQHGGVIFTSINVSLNVKNCNFVGNSAETWGGTIYGDNKAHLVINSTTFKSNSAVKGGGAIIIKKMSHMIIQHCIFEDNSAALGGALNANSNSTLKVTNTQFTKNRADGFGSGGGIHVFDQVQMMVVNCTFKGNNGSFGGSIQGTIHVEVNIIETFFARGQASSEGGAIAVTDQSHLSVVTCKFEENSSPLGGAIHGWSKTIIVISGSHFIKNTGSRGGAIHVTNGYSFEIYSCVFHENFANDYGGALSGLYNRNMKIKMCTLSNNFSNRTGGAIRVGWIEKMSITQCTFTNNTAGQAGAMDLLRVEMIHLRNTTFFRNKAHSTDGGTILFSKTQFKIKECNFHEAKAVGYGGALSGTESKNIIMQNSDFVKNEAAEGGAIFCRHIASFIINETRFMENQAILKAGAVALSLNVSSNIYNSKFNANVAGLGGAISIDHSVQAKFDSVGFFHNMARSNAGALGVEMGENVLVTMRNITCVGNRAALHGGCIGSQNYAKFKIYHSNITGNEAGIYGDAYIGVDTSLEVRTLLSINLQCFTIHRPNLQF